ncbi:MAG: hypothetical protein ACREQ4_13060 [Candidatus Binataceae bacterium]
MRLSVKRFAVGLAVSSTVMAVLFLTGAQAQDQDYSIDRAMKSRPPITQVAGTWIGTDNVDDGGGGTGSGPMALDLTQNQKKIGGTFNVTTGDETPDGTVVGKINGNILNLTFHATSGGKRNCSAKVMATVDGNTMSGTFLVVGGQHCKGKGTFDLQEQ